MMKCFHCYKLKKPTNRGGSSAQPTVISDNTTGTEAEISSESKQTSWLTSSSSGPSIPAIYEERLRNLRVFDLSELKTATNNFSRLLKIGEGGFGSVYKGFLFPAKPKDRKTVVAIKMLNQSSQQGHKEWLAEVQFLSVLEHPNLVKLIGYCAVDGERGIQRLLVYEYMSNKSLEHHLFNKPSSVSPLPWITRLHIALGTARGLDYLHHGFETQIIYRDYKASNVLLDEQLMPKLSDFGLAREGPSGDRTHVTTAVVGTRGYAAPEYVETGHLTAKSDVWSFGVVLFEIITGRASIEPNRPKAEQNLLEWIKQFPVGTKRFHMILDPRLRSTLCSMDSARMVATLANRCLLKNPKDRPTMTDVIDSLENAIIPQEEAYHTDRKRQQTSDEQEPKEEHFNVTESFKRRMVGSAKMGDDGRKVDDGTKHNRRKGKLSAMHVSI